MPEKDFWLALLLCLLYGFTFLGNVIILVVIKVERSFHELMCYFLAMLAATYLSLSSSSMPTMIRVRWFNWCSVTLDACTTQMFFSHTFGNQAVLGIASWQERLKALNTCLSHICALLLFYVPLIGMILSHCLEKHLSPVVHTVMASIYLLVPPVLNPVVYSVRTKEIQQRIAQVFSGGRTGF
ncbi:olfactory receptor 555-like protein [Camelus ferus]|nr:olfactory receptor 555-like protein [Camelus ferus]